EAAGIDPGKACGAAVGDEHVPVVGDDSGRCRESREGRHMAHSVAFDYLDGAPPGMRDEDLSRARLERPMVEGAVGRFGVLDGLSELERHRLSPLKNAYAGKQSVTLAPPSGRLSPVTLPPWAFMVSMTIARPKPAPGDEDPLPRQKRSKIRR